MDYNVIYTICLQDFCNEIYEWPLPYYTSSLLLELIGF